MNNITTLPLTPTNFIGMKVDKDNWQVWQVYNDEDKYNPLYFDNGLKYLNELTSLDFTKNYRAMYLCSDSNYDYTCNLMNINNQYFYDIRAKARSKYVNKLFYHKFRFDAIEIPLRLFKEKRSVFIDKTMLKAKHIFIFEEIMAYFVVPKICKETKILTLEFDEYLELIRLPEILKGMPMTRIINIEIDTLIEILYNFGLELNNIEVIKKSL